MKRMGIAVYLVVLLFAGTIIARTTGQPQSGSVEQELINLENGWAAAQVQGKLDLAFLEGVLADDYLQTNWDGTSETKAQILASLKSKEVMTTYSVGDDYKVRVYGDAAVVTGRWTGKQTSKGEGYQRPVSMDRYVDQEGRPLAMRSLA